MSSSSDKLSAVRVGTGWLVEPGRKPPHSCILPGTGYHVGTRFVCDCGKEFALEAPCAHQLNEPMYWRQVTR